MSLVARYLEENALPTVVFSNARDITQSAHPPRTVFTNYPLGNPCGRPFDARNQRAILNVGLELLEHATWSGSVIDTPHVWSENRDWMRLIFSDEQPFLSPEAEQARKRSITDARSQKSDSAA